MTPTSGPAGITAIGGATLGWAFGCSRTGASHHRAGRRCQDAHALWTASGADAGGIALAVADGHGDDRHDLSHLGSMLAVGAAIEELGDLHTVYALEAKGPQLRSSFKSDFPRRLGRRWRQAVLGGQRGSNGASTPESEEAVLIRHGTTLVAALVVSDVLLIGQIGDGGVLLVRRDGEVECPLPNNPFEVGGETDSLGSPEAPRLWRTAALERAGTELLILATDGLVNAFSDDDQWRAFALSLRDRIREFGWPAVASALPAWLDHYSETASGDDITLVVAVLEPSPAEDGEPGSLPTIEPEAMPVHAGAGVESRADDGKSGDAEAPPR